jgi:hypothetical protein
VPAAFALIHSPLLGPSSWQAVAEELRSRGRRVIVPSLLDAITSPPPRVPVLAAAVATYLDDAAILVVHSGAGPLVPAITDRASSAVDAIVFVDATLPFPGRTWFDVLPAETSAGLRGLAGPDGLLPPWHRWFPEDPIRDLVPDVATRSTLVADIPRVPLDYFEEIAPAFGGWDQRPCGYVRLSAAYDAAAADARGRGWPVLRHEGHHLSGVTEPETVADAIVAMSERLR